MYANKKIGFIGPGKTGITLGAYFKANGVNVIGYAGKRAESAVEAARITNTQAFFDNNNLVKSCDIIFITTPDSQIKYVYEQIDKNLLKGKSICHTSGALNSKVFENIEEYKGFGYSIHPMYAFSEKNGSFIGLNNAYFTVEGNNHHIDDILNFFNHLGNNTFVINSDKKTIYHVANVFVSNLSLALYSIGQECMNLSGINGSDAIKALLPLITANIENISQKGAINALTGPIERNDKETIEKHLDVLPKEYIEIYLNLSMRLIGLVKKKHPDRDYTPLELYLKEKLNSLKFLKEEENFEENSFNL